MGAGRDLAEAEAPAVVPLPPSAAADAAADASQPSRLLIWAVGHSSSGVFDSWAAGQRRPGLALADLAPAGVAHIAELVARHKRPGDIALVSGGWVGVVGECHRMHAAAAVWHAHLHTILCRRCCAHSFRLPTHRPRTVHWGSNWGYDVPKEHRRFAHALIDEGTWVLSCLHLCAVNSI